MVLALQSVSGEYLRSLSLRGQGGKGADRDEDKEEEGVEGLAAEGARLALAAAQVDWARLARGIWVFGYGRVVSGYRGRVDAFW